MTTTSELFFAIAAPVAAALAGFISGNLLSVRRLFWQWLEVRRLRIANGVMTPVRATVLLSDFSSILHTAKEIPNVHRVKLFLGHNGGGLPSPGCRYTVRSVSEWSTRSDEQNNPPGLTFGFDLVIDQDYADMLNQVDTAGSVCRITSQMPDCLLRTIYEQEGVHASIVFKLHRDVPSNTFAYVSVASFDREFTPAEIGRVFLMISRLRALVGAV